MSSADLQEVYMNEYSYFDYYSPCIQEYRYGLKPVSGGTGLGKTSGIVRTVREAFRPGQKGVYTTNRLILLENLHRDFGYSEEVVFLRRDFEVVLLTLSQLRKEFYELLDNRLFRAYAYNVDIPRLRQACSFLEEIQEQFHTIVLPRWLEERAEEQARRILSDFKNVILEAKEKSGKDYNALLKHTIVQSLFPFIAFKQRPKARLLLVTLQKLFYGFFDGAKTINITKLKDYIIFADEFDFLENDLINLICRSPQISDHFRFVEFFHNELRRHKFPLENYPVSASPDIQRRLREIHREIVELQNKGIRYPEINQFISKVSESNVAVFRTSHAVSTVPLYLCQTKRAFEIVHNRHTQCDGKVFRASTLFNKVTAVAGHILTLFKELEDDDPNTHRDLIRDCYRTTNFIDQIAQISQFPRRRYEQSTQLGSLLDSGYSLYDIHHMDKRTDPEEVELHNYTIYLTPEKIISILVHNNLVFALSATGDIPRCVNHFNIEWLRSKEEINVIDVNDHDRAIIENLNAKKAAVRDNRILVSRLEELNDKDTLQKQLKQFIRHVAEDHRFGEDTKEGHRKRRVERFFATLLNLSAKSVESLSTDTHLMFLNTFTQIKLVLDEYAEISNGLFGVHKHDEDKLLTVYELSFCERRFLVVFYNAEQAKRIRKHETAQARFDALFWMGLPVIVVTQYLSAGNGVNLQYKKSSDSLDESDFINLHLLEAPYFYFGVPDDEKPQEENIAVIKENIWYLAKLHAAKYLSQKEFTSLLSKLHAPNEWNNRYQHHPSTSSDYLLNSMAAFIQALGRIERVWQPMPDQTLFLSSEIYRAFQQFILQHAHIREERETTISNNLRQVFEQISAQISQQEREIWRKRDARLQETNVQCTEMIKGLVDRLVAFRQGRGDNRIRGEWSKLRSAVLRHDFNDPMLEQYFCVFKSNYLENGILCLTPQNEIIPVRLEQPDTFRWRVNMLYDVISENNVISSHFSKHGYELDFSPGSPYFFTPYCYQAILAGAIGEEAIVALLHEHGMRFESISDQLFEVTDLKVQNESWYIDCKNYSEGTLDRFGLTPLDPLYHPKLNETHFKRRAIEKWETIANYHGDANIKIIYINLTSVHERPLGYYDRNFKLVGTFNEAEIIVIQGALQVRTPNQYHEAFTRFLNDLKIRQ